ncbi:unnamed protein product [Cladocopium goreaui]|uniref:Coiled-coil domain-containing protein 151 n=1 Tax=Cladocopium goreaui TaxID=2562237 RepID=A0A9P1GE26_9DINO|nr:unnamed protein product [Cladocopium goreaui]
MGCCNSREKTTVVDSSNVTLTRFHLGPLEVDADGVLLKPKFNLGFESGSLRVFAGVRDVRDGIVVDSIAMPLSSTESVRWYMKSYASMGQSLLEFLQEMKAQEPCILDEVITAIPDITAYVLETVGADIRSDKVTLVEGVMYVYVGVGVTAGVYLGWIDTEGFRMMGLQGLIATVGGLGFSLRTGISEEKMSARLVGFLTNVGFDIIIRYREPCVK